MRKILCVLLAVFCITCCSAAAMGESSAQQYEKAMELLKENQYTEAGRSFAALGTYADSPRYTMYCNAIAAGEAGLYSIAVENLNSLSGFLDSNLLAIYYAGLSWEAAEDYEHASEVLGGITLYRDVAARMAGYPALINARDYRIADANEKMGKLEEALSGFLALGDYADSAARAAAVREKIKERDVAAAAFDAADNYSESKEQIYNLGIILREAGNWDDAVKAFEEIGDYSDAATQITETRYQQAIFLNKVGKFDKAYAIYATICGYKDVDNIVKKDENIIAARKAKLNLFKTVGSYVNFGTYPQTKGGKDRTPIEWLVLNYNAKNNCALLISKYGLDVKPYNEENVDITWEKCTLRAWLNGDFYNKAFNDSEQSAILLTNVDNSKNQGYGLYNTSGGESTQDRIFLLSYAEANRYFDVDSNNISASVAPTAYAIEQGAYTSSEYKAADGTAFGCWWLRSPGFFLNLAASIGYDSSVYSINVYDTTGSIRPAFWLDLNADIF